MDESAKWDYCGTLTEERKLTSILTLAENAGMSTGFVTTTRATHASPAPLYAHSVSGDWESDKDKLELAKDDSSKCPDIGRKKSTCMKSDCVKLFPGLKVNVRHTNVCLPDRVLTCSCIILASFYEQVRYTHVAFKVCKRSLYISCSLYLCMHS